jgi:hypothetical protein
MRSSNPVTFWRPLAWREVAFAVVASVVMRVALVGLIDYRGYPGDEAGYYQLIRNLLDHGVFSFGATAPFEPTVLRPPLLPLVGALSFWIFGPTMVPLGILHAAMGILGGLILTLAVARCAPPVSATTTSRATLWATMLCPFDAFFEGRLLTEPLATFFLTAALALPLAFKQKSAWALGGVALGAASLTRDVYLPLVVLLPAITVVWPTVRNRVGLLGPALFLVSALGTLAPWAVRNCTQTPTCTVVSKGALGKNLWVGTWERDGTWQGPSDLSFPDYAFDSSVEREAVLARYGAVDPQTDRFFIAVAMEKIRTHPVRTFARWVRRAPRLWIGTRSDLFTLRPAWLERQSLPWWAYKMSCLLINSAALLLALVGLARAAKRREVLFWLAVPILYSVAIYFPLHSTETRYSAPVYPMLLTFSASGLAIVAEALRRVARRNFTLRSDSRNAGEPERHEVETGGGHA